MNAEYQRLQAEASEVVRQMLELSTTVDFFSASDHAKFERQMGELGRKLASVHHGLALIRMVNSAEMRRRERAFAKALPKKYHSQGPREKIIQSMDGGRVRLRERRRGKTKKGRKKFAAKWREPRLFMIYAVDEEGRMDKDFPPVIDGTLGSCDQLFTLLLAYLKGLNVTEATRVLFVADGATWIWRRIPKLVKDLGLKDEQVQQLIDFWHAMEYLGKIAESKSLKGIPKTRWLKVQKKRLLRGEIGSVVEAIKTLIGPRKTKDQKTWLNYFVTHGLTHRRMDYSRSKDHKMPIGSGAIESVVRRVINLRVKSNATYWLRDNAETMIRLRAWIKAGRAEELFRQTTYITPELAI